MAGNVYPSGGPGGGGAALTPAQVQTMIDDANEVDRIPRTDDVRGVAPTAAEYPDPDQNDTARIRLIDGTKEVWQYDHVGGLWFLVWTEEPANTDCPPYGVTSVVDVLGQAAQAAGSPGRIVPPASTIFISSSVGVEESTAIQFYGLNPGEVVDAVLKVTRLSVFGALQLNTGGSIINAAGAGDYEIEFELPAAYRLAIHPTSTLGSEAIEALASNPITEYAQGPGGIALALPYVGLWNNGNNSAPSGLGFDAATTVTFRSRGNGGTSSAFVPVLRDVPSLAGGGLCARTETLHDLIGQPAIYSDNVGSAYRLSSHKPAGPIDIANTTISTGHDLTALAGSDKTFKFWVSDATSDQRQWAAGEIDVDTMLAAFAAGNTVDAYYSVFSNGFVTLNVIDPVAGDIAFTDANRAMRYVRSELWVVGELGSTLAENTPSTICKTGISVAKTNAEILASPSGIAAEDGLGTLGDHYILYTDTPWSVRGLTGINAANNDHFIAVADQAGTGLVYLWGAGNTGVFTPAATDVLVAQIVTAGTATPFAADGETTLGDGFVMPHVGNLGGLTIASDQFNGSANAGEMDITAGDFAFSNGGLARLQLDGTYQIEGGGQLSVVQAVADGWVACDVPVSPPPQNVVLIDAGVTDVDALLAGLPDLVGLSFHVIDAGAQLSSASLFGVWVDDLDPVGGASTAAVPRGAHGFFCRDGSQIRLAYQTVNP